MASTKDGTSVEVKDVGTISTDGGANGTNNSTITCNLCGVMYKMTAASKHEKRCKVTCEFCKKRHHGRNIAAHVARCKYNKTKCEDCGKKIRARSRERHSSTCKKASSKKAQEDVAGRRLEESHTLQPPIAARQSWEDILEPQVEHAWFQEPFAADVQSRIREGWPTHLDEYPCNHAPADPPGPCNTSCTCMEDWHLGKGSGTAKKAMISETKRRVFQSEESVEHFIGCKKFVKRRGAVSNKHYLEPYVEAPLNLQTRMAQSKSLHFATVCWDLMRDAAREIPPVAFVPAAKGQRSAMRALATAYHAPGDSPHRFHVEQAPPWFNLDCVTGHVLASTVQPSNDAWNAGIVSTVELHLLDVFGNKEKKMELGLKLGEVDCSSLRNHTDHLATEFSQLWPSKHDLGHEQRLADILAIHMQRIFNVLGGQHVTTFSSWVAEMSQIAAVAFGYNFCSFKPLAGSKTANISGSSVPEARTMSMKERFQNTLNATWLSQQGIDFSPRDLQVPDLDLMQVYEEL